MQDSDKDYPSQPIQSSHADYSADDVNLEVDDTEYELAEIQLPSQSLFSTLIIGVLGGLLATAISVAITFMNASLFHEASQQGDKMLLSTAQTITELGCFEVFIDLLLCFVAGYIMGRIAVLRRQGLLVGALAGAITALGGFIVHSLPNYPDKIVSTAPSSSGAMVIGLLAAVLFVLIYSAIGALTALWGAWTATRKHPYYQLQTQK